MVRVRLFEAVRRAVVLLASLSVAIPTTAQLVAPASAPAGGHRVAEPALPGAARARRATQDDADSALQTLNRLVEAYESSDVAAFEALLANNLPGRQRMIEGFVRGLFGKRIVRIHLLDLQISAGPDVAFIQAAWERRSLAAASFEPQLTSGRFNLLARRGTGGARRTLPSIEGDNPFAPAASSFVGARLTVSAANLSISTQ